MQPLAVALITAIREAGLPAGIVAGGGLRGTAEQRRLVQAGLSKTLKSRHLSGDAFDLDLIGFNRDAIPAEFWAIVGPFGESLGLRWGGRFRGFPDVGHFESRS